MLTLTPTQVAQSSVGSVPEAMRGTIKKVWKRTDSQKNPQYLKQGENPVGSIQKLIVTDGTTEIQVMIDDRDAIPESVTGSSILVMAFKGDRGLVGLKRRDNVYNGVTSPQLWVNKTADLVIEAPGGNGHTPPQRTATPPAAQRQTPANSPANGNGNRPPAAHQAPSNTASPVTPAARAQAIKEYDRRLARSTAAYERCFDAAYRMALSINERHKDAGGFKPEAHTLEKMAACLMVQSCWGSKPADIEAFPIRHFSLYDPAGNLIRTAPSGQQPPPQDPDDGNPPFNA